MTGFWWVFVTLALMEELPRPQNLPSFTEGIIVYAAPLSLPLVIAVVTLARWVDRGWPQV